MWLDSLQRALRQTLGDARLLPTPLPGLPLKLWLIDPANMRRAFGPEETRRILHAPPYWCFCWASGQALARWLHDHPERVRGQRVLDFGAGSGIAGIAAARAGAAEVVACDLDPLALEACRANAALNGVRMSECSDFRAEAARCDVLLAADVLYDRDNLPLLDAFVERAASVIVADSRVRDFRHPRYRRTATLDACTWPDLGESEEFRRVSLYESRPPRGPEGASPDNPC
jgi:predicted nicotinamide N-methyase